MDDDHSAVYEALHKAQQNSRIVALATIISTKGSMPRHAGSKLLIHEDGSIVGTVGGGAMESLVIKKGLEIIQTGASSLESFTLNNLEDGDPGICGGSAQIFIERIGFNPTLLVIGGGHCGKELAQLGKWMGYRVVLSDDRETFCNESYVSGLDEYIVCPASELPQHITINQNTYVAALTRGLPVDIHLVPALLNTPAPYIGIIGSRRRWAISIKALKEEHGLTEQELSRIHSPIGLELQAETPKEIALSIMAEIIMIRRGGSGEPMKWIGKPEEASA